MKHKHLRSIGAAALAVLVPIACAAAPRADMASRVQACVACHGENGRSTNQGYVPRIAGKPSGYLYHQLLNFRDGRRQHAAMAYLLEHMSDAYLREIAGHFAAMDLPYPPPRFTAAHAAVLARGESLVRTGDSKRGIPACTACHGASMMGALQSTPGLLGLPRDYLLGQLGAWRTGLRKSHAPDCMAEIARRLSHEDVGAVATWLSLQPAIGAPASAEAKALDGPMRCAGALP